MYQNQDWPTTTKFKQQTLKWDKVDFCLPIDPANALAEAPCQIFKLAVPSRKKKVFSILTDF